MNVFNALAIHYDHEDLLFSRGQYLDFGILVPMPESLDIEDLGIKRDAIALYLYRTKGETELLEQSMLSDNEFEVDTCEEYADALEEEYPRLMSLGERYVRNMETYGHYTWRSWSKSNWGCERLPGYCHVECTRGLLIVYFTTQNDVPTQWLKKLSEYAPFYLEWATAGGKHGEVSCSERGIVHEKSLADVEAGYEVGNQTFYYNPFDDFDYVPSEEGLTPFEKAMLCVCQWESEWEPLEEKDIETC